MGVDFLRTQVAPRGGLWPSDLGVTGEWAASRVKGRLLSELKPHPKNARTHSTAQVAQLVASLREFGWTIPVLIDEDGTILAGHGRVMAAKQIGWTEGPTVTAAGWSDAKKRAYLIAANKLALNADWDEDLLGSELQALAASYDIGLIGFTDEEAQALYARGGAPGADPETTPPPPATPSSVLGDVWRLGAHTLACGSSTDPATVAAVLRGVKPHLMVTDPPYGVEYDPAWRARVGVNKNVAKMGVVENDGRSDWCEAWALFGGDVAYVWHAGRFASSVQASLEAVGFAIRCQIIWAKDRFALSRGHYHWQHEPCWYAVRNTGHWAGDRKQSTLWEIAARDDSGHGHSTQKPIECMRRPIENNSKPGDAIYEPFSGSGTTIIAAEMTNRACHAIELNPVYVDVAIRRWEDFTGRQATLGETEETFAQVVARRAAETQAAA